MIIKQLSKIDVREIIERHAERITKNHYELLNPEDITTDGSFEPRYRVIEGKPCPRKNMLIPKYMFLIHLIIEKCSADKDGFAYLPTSKYEPIFGRQFYEMLHTLEDMKIISMGYYQNGVNSRPITLNDWHIEEVDTKNRKVIELAKEVEKKTKSERAEYIADDDFSVKYNASLEQLSLNHEKAMEYTNNKLDKYTHRYNYYLHSISHFTKDRMRIISVDKNGRIYHPLTNFPRDLKQFTNIHYSIDVHNSHPLMVNHYLINYYNINKDIIKIINEIEIGNINNHNECKQLCKDLKQNKLWKDMVKGIPSDVLLYIITTSKGIFWDILSKLTGVDRHEIKGNSFQEIYYGRNRSTRGKAFGKVFVELYPHVWSVLRKLKKADDGLANTMMQVEARIMKDILNALYGKGYMVASIHDAVIVPICEENKDFDKDVAVSLMKKVYARYGLYPTLDVEDYTNMY